MARAMDTGQYAAARILIFKLINSHNGALRPPPPPIAASLLFSSSPCNSLTLYTYDCYPSRLGIT
jgi:hypothetical protein